MELMPVGNFCWFCFYYSYEECWSSWKRKKSSCYFENLDLFKRRSCWTLPPLAGIVAECSMTEPSSMLDGRSEPCLLTELLQSCAGVEFLLQSRGSR